MPLRSDCCCFCFTLKTGVMLIGILTAINFFALLGMTTIYHIVWWYFLPGTILCFLTSLKCLYVYLAYGQPYDTTYRVRFLYTYLINQVILLNAWTLVYRIVWPDEYMYHICQESYECVDENAQLNSVGAIIGLQLPSFFINCYFCFVIKLYAD